MGFPHRMHLPEFRLDITTFPLAHRREKILKKIAPREHGSSKTMGSAQSASNACNASTSARLGGRHTGRCGGCLVLPSSSAEDTKTACVWHPDDYGTYIPDRHTNARQTGDHQPGGADRNTGPSCRMNNTGEERTRHFFKINFYLHYIGVAKTSG